MQKILRKILSFEESVRVLFGTSGFTTLGIDLVVGPDSPNPQVFYEGKTHLFPDMLGVWTHFFQNEISGPTKTWCQEGNFYKKGDFACVSVVFFGMGGILVCAKSKEEAHGRGSRYTPNGRYRYARKVTESNCTPQGSKISHKRG